QRTFGGRTNGWEYDGNGYVSRVTDNLPSAVEFQRDAMGRLLTTHIVDGPTWALGRDANGDVTSITPPEQPAHGIQLNALGQILAYSPPVGAAIDVGYDHDHQPLAFTTGTDALGVT